MHSPQSTRKRETRGAFTLVELLIVITIMLIITGLTVATFNTLAPTDRMRAGARTLQASFQGAVSRSLFEQTREEGRLVGIRLILDPDDPSIVRSLAYIIQPPIETEGTVEVPDDGEFRRVLGTGTNWKALFNQELLVDGSRIKIGTEGPFTVDVSRLEGANPTEELILTRRASKSYPEGTQQTLVLGPGLMPNEDPIELPNGVVIDLFYSIIPAEWIEEILPDDPPYPPWTDFDTNECLHDLKDADGNDLQGIITFGEGMPNRHKHMDILFSPGGPVAGSLAAFPAIHLMLVEAGDAAQGLLPEESEGEKLIVTIIPQTGSVTTHQVFPLDLERAKLECGYPRLRYKYAASGQKAGQ